MKRPVCFATRAAAAVLAGLLGCMLPTHPEMGGGLSLQFDASAAAWDSVKVFVSGPTNKSVKGTPGTTVTIDGLVAGRYTLAIEAFQSGGVVSLFQTTDVNIVANQNASVAPAAAEFVPFVPTMGSLPATGNSAAFTVSYTSVAGAASYEVEAATDQAFTTNRVAVTSTETSAQITVSGDGGYYVRVRAIDAYQGRGQASPSKFIQITTPVGAPSGLTATASSTSQINLGWTDNATNESGFRIERCVGVGCTTFTEFAIVGANVTTYQNTGLTANTTYRYQVRAYNGAGNSAYSNIASSTTATNPPNAPTALTATGISDSQVNLSWTDNATTEDGFKIERCTGAGCTIFTQIATVGASVTTYQDNTGLTANTTYRYQVRAYNVAGNSNYSNIASVTTGPVAPTVLTATAFSSTQINLSWTDNATNETGFRIERCSGVACTTFTEIGTVGANVTTYQSTGLAASTSYSYRVRAYNAAGNSGYSNTASATTATAPPAAPSGLAATTISDTQINLSWTDNATNEDGFGIERCTGATCTTFVEIGTVLANVTTYQSTGLTANTPYRYQVRAYNAGGNSGYSTLPGSVTTGPVPPSALTATTISSAQINLSWTDNATNETGFRIERCSGVGCTTFTEIAIVAANVTSYPNTGLTANTTYGYQVRAYTAAGNSGYSNTASATTGPVAPSALNATEISDTEIDLSWTDNAANEDGFRIERCSGAACTTFVEIATVAANVTTYQSTGLTASTTYRYQVRAYNVAGNSGYTTPASATTGPVAPSALTATAVSSTQINLSWTDNATNELGFYIERCTGVACTMFAQIAAVGPNPPTPTTYQNVTGLTAAMSYSYRVRAYNGNGNSGYSNTATAIPPP